MRFDADTRAQVYVDMTLDFDPTDTTIEVEVDGTWHAATWQNTAVQSGGKWTQTALTADYFAGPAVTSPNGATVLTAGRHMTQTRVTSGSSIIASNSSPIDVEAA